MNAQDSDALVQRLYDRIVLSLTQDGGGTSAAFDPNKTFFTLEPRGRIIDPEDYAGAWTQVTRTAVTMLPRPSVTWPTRPRPLPHAIRPAPPPSANFISKC